MLTKDLAICIRATDYSETSQIVMFFTRLNGKITAIAKGSKRPKSSFDGPIEIFSYGRIVFSDPRLRPEASSNREKLATLTEFQQQPGFSGLASNLSVLNCCLFAAELTKNLTDDYDPHPQLFDNFLQFLKSIQDTSHESRATISLLILFQLSLLKEIGLMPVWDYCVNCKTRHERRATSDEFYFSSSANGLICRDCEASFPDKIKLTETAANCLINRKLIAESDERTLNEIEKMLISHFTQIMGRQPKMAKHILKS